MKSYLSVSNVSALGMCETKAYEYLQIKARPQNAAMKEGAVAHEKLTEKLPKVSKEQVIEEIKSGRRVHVRELSVFDSKLHIVGRIDQLDVTGIVEDGKNTGIIIDDKFPKETTKIYGLTLYYKLQLASYAAAMENSYDYGSICKIIGARLIYREKQSNSIIRQFEMDRNRLNSCTFNISIAVEDTWKLYRKEKGPEHRRFDVENGNWVGCYCNGQGFKL